MVSFLGSNRAFVYQSDRRQALLRVFIRWVTGKKVVRTDPPNICSSRREGAHDPWYDSAKIAAHAAGERVLRGLLPRDFHVHGLCEGCRQQGHHA